MRSALIVAACALALAAGGSAGGAPKRPLLPTEIAFWNEHRGLALFRRANCYDRSGCVAVGRTRDGGRSWALTPVGSGWGGLAVAPRTVAWAGIAPDPTRCAPRPVPVCLLRVGETLRSRDSGRTWEIVEPSTYAPRNVSFATRSEGFAFIGRRLVRTADGGRSWHEVRTPCDPSRALDVSFATPRRGWLLCAREYERGTQPQALFATADGGRRWRLVMDAWYTRSGQLSPGAVYPGGFAGGISFSRRGVGLLWQSGGLTYRTSDGGRTWSSLRFTTTGYGVSGGPGAQVSSRTAYLLVHMSAKRRVDLRRTDDGGHRWRVVRVWRSS